MRCNSKPYIQTSVFRPQFSPAPLNAARSTILRSSRWYSDEAAPGEKKVAEEVKEETKPAAEPAEKKEEAKATESAEAELKKKLEVKEREAIDWKDKYLRSVADFRNLQDRTQRDMKSARDFAIQKFAKDLVDTVDNLERALTMGQEKLKAAEAEGEQKNEAFANFYEGVKMTESLMLQTLAKHGLERIDPAEGEHFDPNVHEATFMTPMPGKEESTIFHVQQKGFKLNGRVLRAPKVGVVKNQ